MQNQISPEAAISQVIKPIFTEDRAKAQIASLLLKAQAEENGDGGKSAGMNIVVGLIFLILGIVLTAVSYSASEGSSYVLFYGLILVGIFKIIQGASTSS